MHRLLMKYTFGRGEEFQRTRDAKSQDLPPEEAPSESESDDYDSDGDPDFDEKTGGWRAKPKVGALVGGGGCVAGRGF